MNLRFFILSTSILFLALSCKKEEAPVQEATPFDYVVDQFADIRILRYQIPGWDDLSLQQQQYAYYLTQAGLAGRDIIWDQNYRHNLKIRKALEHIYVSYQGDKNSANWKEFVTYLKRVWFANGIHHHYSKLKFRPGFDRSYFDDLLRETATNLEPAIVEVLFNDLDNKKVNRAAEVDKVQASAVNFYGEDVTEKEALAYYAKYNAVKGDKPIEIGLNSKLVKQDGELVELTWKSGGLYGPAIDKIIYWLEKASEVAENEAQKKQLELLIEYYKTGDLKIWDDYNILWATNTEGDIDYINGFVEVYEDPLGYKGSYENIVQIKDFDMSKKMAVVADNAQWFEDNSPLIETHKKKNVIGVSYKTVNVAGEAGDASPSTPIGVNLPNNNWIRQTHGSKSVSLGNIIDSYNQAGGSGRLKEFANDEEEIELEEAYGIIGDKIHTALHEVIGHASGQINEGVGTPKETLGTYASTMEEGRADLVALYYLMDPKLQELGLVDNWEAVGKAAYDGYIRNGLMTQLIRIEPGHDIEEDHMRNRQMVSAWVFEKGKTEGVIERIDRDGKTYFNILDYAKLRTLFGELLRETQRIKSEGDFEAAKALVEGYGVKVDQNLHSQILERNKKFTSAPYSGFVNPVLTPVMDEQGNITAIDVVQPVSFEEQMLQYAKEYSTLSMEN